MELEIELYAFPGSKRKRFTLLDVAVNGTVGDLFAVLRRVEKLPEIAAAEQQLCCGLQTLTVADADRSLADMGIRDGHQLKHLLVDDPGVPRPQQHEWPPQPLARVLELVDDAVKGMSGDFRDELAWIGHHLKMETAMYTACRTGDLPAAYSLAMYGAPSSRASLALLLQQVARDRGAHFNLVEAVLEAAEVAAEAHRLLDLGPSGERLRAGLGFALALLEAAGEWQEAAAHEEKPWGQGCARRLLEACSQRPEWRALVGCLLEAGLAGRLPTAVLAYVCLAPDDERRVSALARATGRLALLDRHPRGALAIVAVAAAPWGQGADLAHPRARELLESGELSLGHPSIAAALLAGITAAAGDLGWLRVQRQLDRPPTRLAALVSALVKCGAGAVALHCKEADRRGPLLPEPVLLHLLARGCGLGGPAALGTPEEAAALVAALGEHAATRALAGGSPYAAARAGLKGLVAALERAAAAVGGPVWEGPAVDESERALSGVLAALALFAGRVDLAENPHQRAIAARFVADLLPRAAAAVATALRALDKTRARPSPPSLDTLSTRPVDFVWRATADVARLAQAVGCAAALGDVLRPFSPLLSSCGYALLLDGGVFWGSSFARVVACLPDCVSDLLRSAANADAAAASGPTLRFTVARNAVLESSVIALGELPRFRNRNRVAKMVVEFAGEPAHGPGVRREALSLVAKALLDPAAGLFRCAEGSVDYTPEPVAGAHPDRLSMFRACGVLMGVALVAGAVFPVNFPEGVYDYLLNRTLELASIEPTVAGSLEGLLTIDVTGLALSFAVTEEDRRDVDLLPGGADVEVTEANKATYVRLRREHHLRRIRPQLEAMREGFRRVLPSGEAAVAARLPAEAAAGGLPARLRRAVEGDPQIDVAEWRSHTEYGKGLTASSRLVRWFWRHVESLGPEARSRLLAFATGSPRPPHGGFARLVSVSGLPAPFTIVTDNHDTQGRLPSAHTCANQLELPRYGSFAELKRQLDAAVAAGLQEGASFGFA